MVRSSRQHVRALRQACIARAGGRCEAALHHSECAGSGQEMAHIFGRGMGGSAVEDQLDRVAWLSKPCHDLLDGRRIPIALMGRKVEPGRRRRMADELFLAVNS